jgi:hypothetical protein
MSTELASFAFIITLAAVVNGLGIVRWLTGLAEYLRRKDSLSVKHYWVYSLIASFQFLLHILMWWSLWGVRGDVEINFLMYVYLLAGPIFLFLGTSVLVPGIDEDELDMRTHYFSVRQTYSIVLMLLWLWAIFLSPVLRGTFAPTMPLFALFFVFALIQRMTTTSTAQGIIAALNWLLLIVFVATYAMQLGGTIS